MKLTSKSLTKAAFEVFAPQVISGYLKEAIKGLDIKGFYEWRAKGSIWDRIPSKNFLLSYRPWDLEWLTVAWTIKAIAEVNPKIAALIMSSQDLQSGLDKELKEIKEQLE